MVSTSLGKRLIAFPNLGRTLSIIHSRNTLFNHVYINSTSTHGSSRNTDGADTIYSSHITFRNWEVDNGDDSISLKANSTDIVIEDSLFHRGLGIAIGSIGQYKGVWESIERVRVRNVSFSKTLHTVYFKTWTGEQVNYPPNGGGGGLGCMFLHFFENRARGRNGWSVFANVLLQLARCIRYDIPRPQSHRPARPGYRYFTVYHFLRYSGELHLVRVPAAGFVVCQSDRDDD